VTICSLSGTKVGIFSKSRIPYLGGSNRDTLVPKFCTDPLRKRGTDPRASGLNLGKLKVCITVLWITVTTIAVCWCHGHNLTDPQPAPLLGLSVLLIIDGGI
jgi:hypothetical protein